MKTRLLASAMLVLLLSLGVVSFHPTPSVAKSHVSAHKRILGTTARRNPDYNLIKDAGIGWVRVSFRFPWEDKVGGKLSDDFLKSLEEAKTVRRAGLRVMGGTPFAGVRAYSASDNQTIWRPRIPAWAGTIDSESYYDTYEKACEELARQTRGIVDMWQVANEMDISLFKGPLTTEQVERFLMAGARGLKAVNPKLKVDINPAGMKGGEQLFRDLYSRPDTPFDYAGIDGYFGSTQVGGPEGWIPLIDRIYEITHKPVLINEWGYSSLAGSGVPLNRKVGISVCENQAWKLVWRKEHSPEEQAAFVEEGMKIFATYPHVAGAFFFEWNDNPVCPHCGTKGCPMECGWGLVDSEGKPKPAFYAFKAAAHEYF